jgi:hypothetical protein
MAAGVYTRTNLTDRLNSLTGGKNNQLLSLENLMNSAVRFVINDIDLRGTKRNALLAPNLFDDIYDYTLPSDTKKIIDIQPQVDRAEMTEWDLVTEDEFDRKKTRLNNLITITDDDMVRRLRVSRRVDGSTVVLAQLESLGGDGDTWAGFGGVNDSDIKKDGNDFLKGSASLRFSAAAGTDTAIGIQNKGLTANDLSEYLANGSIFVRGRLTTGDTNIKQLNVRLGSDTTNYYTVTDSTTNENIAFETGWNLVRLDLSGKTTTGSPVDTAIDYVAAFWSTDSDAHASDTDWAFDHITINKGKIHRLLYYSRFVWQTTSTAVYKENSTVATDTLSLYNDEIEMIIAKAWELASYELGNKDKAVLAKNLYNDSKKAYKVDHPSEAKILVSMPYEMGTVVGSRANQQSNRLDS